MKLKSLPDGGTPTLPAEGYDDGYSSFFVWAVCASDGDCTEAAMGHCDADIMWEPSTMIYACTYGCESDADCREGYRCRCGERWGSCARAHCSTDADCAPGRHCRYFSSTAAPCATITGYACTTDEDECSSDSQCNDGYGCIGGAEGFSCLWSECSPAAYAY